LPENLIVLKEKYLKVQINLLKVKGKKNDSLLYPAPHPFYSWKKLHVVLAHPLYKT